MMYKEIFETERLIIRPFTMDDLEDAYQMNLDPEISKYTGDGGVQSREIMEQRLRDNILGDYAKYGYGRFAVIDKASNTFIGFTGLKYLEDLKETDLGYRFIRSHWGKGIATESCRPIVEYGFKHLGLKKMIGLVIPENRASSRVLEKLGFTFEKLIKIDNDTVAYYTIERP